MQELGGEAGGHGRLVDQRVHLAVDSDAPVAGAFEGLLGEPVAHVPPAQHLHQAVVEFAQLELGHVPSRQADEVHQEVGGGQQF